MPSTQLQPGSIDTAAVKQLQSYLVNQGFLTAAQMATAPGIYGPQTTAAVAALQKAHGVDNSSGVGFYGPLTIAALQKDPAKIAPTSNIPGGWDAATYATFKQANPTAEPNFQDTLHMLSADVPGLTPGTSSWYWQQPGESVDAYHTRISSVNANMASAGTPSSTGMASSGIKPSPYVIPSAPTPGAIPADSLSSPAQPLTMPAYAPASSDYYKSLLASIPTSESITSTLSPDQLAARSTQKTIAAKMQDYLASLSTKSSAQSAAEAAAGLPDLTAQLTDVTSKIKTLQNEAAAIPLEDQNNSEGREITTAGLAPIEAGRLRENAIQALGLSSIAATLQGNITLAQSEADRAVAAEFDPIQSQLDYLKDIYSINADQLSEADKDQAVAIQAKLQDRQEQIDNAKQEKQSVIAYVNSAVQNGAPASVAAQALKSDSASAIQLLAPYMKAKSDAFTLSKGQARYDANGKLIASVPADGTGDGSTVFTSTQLNKGASNAGISTADFKQLDPTTKNFFINGYGDFVALQKKIDSGELTTQEAAQKIQDSAAPEAAKTILLNILGVDSASASDGSSGGGFWDTVGSLFGGATNAVKGLFGL